MGKGPDLSPGLCRHLFAFGKQPLVDTEPDTRQQMDCVAGSFPRSRPGQTTHPADGKHAARLVSPLLS